MLLAKIYFNVLEKTIKKSLLSKSLLTRYYLVNKITIDQTKLK